jgi:hypothetical protein
MSGIHQAVADRGREQLATVLILQRAYYVVVVLLLVLMIPSFLFALLVWQSPGSQMLVICRSFPSSCRRAHAAAL